MKYMTIKLMDGIILVTFNYGLKITLDIAKEMVQERIQMQQGVSHPLVIVAKGFKIDSKEVREYLKKEGIVGLKSGAFVVENIFEKVMVNFFLIVVPPKVPSKMFTNLEEAMEWSKKYR